MADLRVVVFDYYETLAELSPQTRERTFDEIASKVGVELPSGEAYRHWRELTTKDWELRLAGRRRPPLDGVAPPFVAFHEVWSQRSSELFAQWGVDVAGDVGAEAYSGVHAAAAVYPEVPAALDALKTRSRLAVLSDADSSFLTSSLRRNGLSFETVVSSEEMRAYKPHVSLFREVCARLNVDPSEAVYVGDTPWSDIAGARHAGMRAVWINRHDAEWPADIEPPEEVVSSLAELPELLQALA